MFACDAAQEEMLQRMALGPPVRLLAPPRPPTSLRFVVPVVAAVVGGWYLYEYERHGGAGQVRIIAYERGVRGKLLATAKVTCLEGKCTSGPGVLEP